MGEFFEQYPLELLQELATLRAQLTERDREIERLPLTHVWKAQDGTVKAELYGTPDLDLVAIQNQLSAKGAEAAELRAQLAAFQAREREAVERAERADQSVRSMAEKQLENAQEQHDWEMVSLRLAELEEGRMSLESALAAAQAKVDALAFEVSAHMEDLAAARKALEEAPCVRYVPGYSCLTANPRPPFFCRRCAALERINGERHE